MSANTITPDDRRLPDPPDFSPFLGGPLFQLLRRTRLSGDAMELLHRRILALSLFAWLPLLVLSTLEAGLGGGSAALPFLADIAVHVRFLLALPLLIVAELVVHQRMRSVVTQFLERQLIPEDAMPRFRAAIASALRLRESALVEGLLVAVVYIVGVQILWRRYAPLQVATWYAAPTSGGGFRPSLAGIWYGYVSLPLLQFLLCRWYFRLIVWARFLWQVSRIDLKLMPMHPDGAGGLGFLGGTADALAPFAAAHGALLAGMIANRIFHLGAALPDAKVEILAAIAVLLCVVFGPLLVFVPQLARARRAGSREYGLLAARYVREFDAKWLHRGAPAEEPLVGSADIQSLADLGNSFEVVRTMRPVPFATRAIVHLAFTTLAPIVPLALTMMPLDELVKKLFGILF